MARVQLALNVSNLDEAIDFYTRLFATPPAKVRPCLMFAQVGWAYHRMMFSTVSP